MEVVEVKENKRTRTTKIEIKNLKGQRFCPLPLFKVLQFVQWFFKFR